MGTRTAAPGAALAAAETAYDRQDWDRAAQLYREAIDAASDPGGDVLFKLAMCLKYTGTFEEPTRLVERAYRAFVGAGDHQGAARCATAITGLRMIQDDRPGATAWERRGW